MNVGKRIGGRRRTNTWAEITVRFGDIPAYPDAYVLPPYRHPAPPLLERALSPHKKAVMLAQVYTATMRHFLRLDGHKWASPLKEDRNYLLLRQAAHEMELYSIAPQAWVKFSLEVFLRYGKGRYPQPNFVFSQKRLASRQEWFSWDESFNAAQGVVWVAPEHRKLLGLYEKMKRALLAEDILTVERVREIVWRTLPPDVYRMLTRRSLQRYQKRSASVRERLERWEWVW